MRCSFFFFIIPANFGLTDDGLRRDEQSEQLSSHSSISVRGESQQILEFNKRGSVQFCNLTNIHLLNISAAAEDLKFCVFFKKKKAYKGGVSNRRW